MAFYDHHHHLPLIIIMFISSWSLLVTGEAPPVRTCEPIEIEMCQHFGYSQTGMPNFAGDDSQHHAEAKLQTYSPLIQYGCSDQLKFFLCSVHAPMCTPKVEDPIGPCQSLCLSVMVQCFPVLKKFGYGWPDALNCTRFPPQNTVDHMCMDGNISMPPATSTSPPKVPPSTTQKQPPTTTAPTRAPVRRPDVVVTERCPQMRHPENYIYFNHTQTCHLLCGRDGAFTSEEKLTAAHWLTSTSVIGFLLMCITLLTYLINQKRFQLADRPFLFMVFAYLGYCIGTFVHVSSERDEVSCDKTTSTILQDGLQNGKCAAVFVFVYYFSLSAQFLLLFSCLFIFFSLGLPLPIDPSQPNRRINLMRGCFTWMHIISWGVPAVVTIVVLIMRHVEADELTGVCGVGMVAQPTWLYQVFMLVPSILILLTSLGLLLLTLAFENKVKAADKFSRCEDDAATSSVFTSSWSRIVITCGTSIFANVYMIGINFYEYLYHDKWHVVSHSRPVLETLYIRLLVVLIPGVVTSLVALISGDTSSSWRTFLTSCSSAGSSKPSIPPPSGVEQNIPLNPMGGGSKVNQQRAQHAPSSSSSTDYPIHPHRHHHQQHALLQQQQHVLLDGSGGDASSSRIHHAHYPHHPDTAATHLYNMDARLQSMWTYQVAPPSSGYNSSRGTMRRDREMMV